MFHKVKPSNYPSPEDPPKQPNKDISINITLDGYEKLKTQLNDIESQIDRILKKAEKLNKL